MSTWPERPKTADPLLWPHEGQRPHWRGLDSINWIGDDYPTAAIPGRDLWNGKMIPERVWD